MSIFVDSRYIYEYYNYSERVTRACEARNLKGFLRELLLLYLWRKVYIMGKPYTTYEEQIIILKNKRLLIPDERIAIDLLKRCSYFGLITGYKHPFKDKNGLYKLHTSIKDVYALYNYDMELRELVLKYILIIENHIKSLISYSFCQTYGNSELAYLNANNYDYTDVKQNEINKLIGKFKFAMSEYDSHPYLQHQRENHGNIPLWVLTKVITIGIISKMYSLLRPQVQTLICKEFDYITEDELARMIDLLSRFRNVCAHNERLYDYKYIKGEIKTTAIHSNMSLKKNKGRYVQGKKDLFAVVIIFKYLLKENDFTEFIERFSNITEKLLLETSVLQEKQILKIMGFPLNWKDILHCSKELVKID